MSNEDGTSDTKAEIALFFVGYLILVNIVLLNVVVAVILDGERQSAVARFSQQHRGLVSSIEV
jgi:hypothetical protein